MSRPDVSVCIPSYRRPEGLFALLGALDAQVFEGEAPEIQIVVVDNDAEGSAREVCEAAREWLRYPLCYVVEKHKGIPIARNAAVAAGGEATWIAFIDDNETPSPDWLDTLLRAQLEYEGDVVTGPVLPRFAERPPRWVVEGGFFDAARHATGAELTTAYTNNVLVRTRCLDALPTLFDERFRLGVGEDRDLFERIAARGGRIVWCAEARVHETLPADRTRVRWLLRRSFRVGASNTHISRSRDGVGVGTILLHGAWCVAKGSLLACQGLALLPAPAVRGLSLAAFGVGRCCGLFGIR